MSKLFKVLIGSFSTLAVAVFAASTFTGAPLNLELPADGDQNWGNSYRSNLTTINTQAGVTATGLSDHITDPVGAHAATAVSTAVGTTLCTSSTTAQAFLECLDSNVGAVVGGTVMTTNTAQDVSATKTFNAVQLFTSGITQSGGTLTLPFSTGLLHSDGSGVISSSAIVDADVDASAAIAYSKLDLTGDIVDADINSSAAIAYSKLDLTGDIVDADISASAAIVDTKLDTIATSGKVSNSATTATDANTASAIVARDASGNFTAGTVTSNTDLLKTSLQIEDPDGGTNKVTIQASTSLAVDYTLTLPVDDGAANQVLGTNGSGDLSWVDATSGYSANTDTTLTSSDTLAIGTGNADRLQHWRIQTSSGAVTMSTSPFGSSNPQDRTSICVMNIGTDPITFPINDAADGIVGFGDVILDQWESACFRYMSTDDRFVVESRSN